MLNSRHNIHNLVAMIYEYQKKIVFNRRAIRELELSGSEKEINRIKAEIEDLQKKIVALKQELNDRYQI